MKTETLQTPQALTWLDGIFKQNGPEKYDYFTLNNALQYIEEEIHNGNLEIETIEKKFFNGRFVCDQASVIGHSRSKPYGYSGDFSIIDRIYTMDVSPEHKKWDEYSLSQDASKAIRNRKDYFKKIVNGRLPNGGNLLNAGSGPARDLMELYHEGEHKELLTTCVEMDERAVAYAKELTSAFSDRIRYVHNNILTFKPQQKFDMIWSAGLFDHFDDLACVLMLKKFKNWLKPGGEIVIGNFNQDYNPSRSFMELLCDWYLIHRNRDDLLRLAHQAGFEYKHLKVESEPEGINLFLRLSN